MILALGLTALVLVILGMAMDFHLRVLDNGRSHVEEAQLARAVLQLIATDLRSVVIPNPIKIDASALSFTATGTGTGGTGGGAAGTGTGTGGTGGGAAGTGTGTGGTGGGAAGTGTGTGGTGGGAAGTGTGTGGTGGGAAATGTAQTFNIVDSTCPQTVPGIYGTADAIQVDASRPPRVDELLAQAVQAAQASGNTATRFPGSVRTVTYFVVPPDGTLAGQTAGGLTTGTGLVRREMDRTAAAYTESASGMSDPQMGLEPIAPEVAAIEFLYFDGAEWTDVWNSEELGGPPRAIQIRVSIIPKKLRDRGVSPGVTAGALLPEDLLTYSLVVYLPGSDNASP